MYIYRKLCGWDEGLVSVCRRAACGIQPCVVGNGVLFQVHDGKKKRRLNGDGDVCYGWRLHNVPVEDPQHGELLRVLGQEAMDGGSFKCAEVHHVEDSSIHRKMVWQAGQGVGFYDASVPGKVVVGRVSCFLFVGRVDAKGESEVEHIVFMVDVLGLPVSGGDDLCPTVPVVAMKFGHAVSMKDVTTLVRLLPSPLSDVLWAMPVHQPF